MPGPREAFHARRETVHRDHRRRAPAHSDMRELPIDRGVIGLEQPGAPLAPLRPIERGIGGDRDAVALARDRARIIGMAIAVDDEPRIASEHSGRIEQGRKAARHRGSADVPADMLRQNDLGQAKPIQRRRHNPAGMIAGQQHRRGAARVTKLENGWVVRDEKGLKRHRSGNCCDRAVILSWGVPITRSKKLGSSPDPLPLLRRLLDAALDAADPAKVLPPRLPPAPKGRTIVIGAGKAAAKMARAVEDHWPAPLAGLVVTRYGHSVPCRRIEVVEAAHPVPDAAGQAAAKRILAMVKGLSHDDLVICLLSGGASALLALPTGNITLE